MMDQAIFNCDQVDDGDWDLRDRPLVDGSNGKFANHSNGFSGRSSKLYPYSLYPSSSYNYDPYPLIPSVIGFLQIEGMLFLSDRDTRDTPLLDGSHGIISDCGNVDSDGSSKLGHFSLSLSSSSND